MLPLPNASTLAKLHTARAIIGSCSHGNLQLQTCTVAAPTGPYAPLPHATRYTNKRGEMGDVDVSEMYVQTVRNRRVQIELVGEEMIQAQQKQIQHLPSARIVGAAVSHLVSCVGGSVSGMGRGVGRCR